jgi:hypothetical protein
MNIRTRYFFVIALMISVVVPTMLLASHPSRAVGAWYVASSGSDNNDCQNFATPCATINGALNKGGFAAGDTILVATGVYTGTSSEVVLLNKDANVSGGWDAAFTTQSGRATIDGQGQRRGVEVRGQTVTLDRFVIQNGFQAGQGGGILNSGGVLTLTNSIVSGNVGRLVGGGIFNNATLTINNSTIRGNTAGDPCCTGGGGGGGIGNWGSVTLNDSTVSENTIVGGFSASGIYNTSLLVVNNSTIAQNHGGSGEGIFSLWGAV